MFFLVHSSLYKQTLDPPSAVPRLAFFLSVVALLWRTPCRPVVGYRPLLICPREEEWASVGSWSGRCNQSRTVVDYCYQSCLVWGFDRVALIVVMTRSYACSYERGQAEVIRGSEFWDKSFSRDITCRARARKHYFTKLSHPLKHCFLSCTFACRPPYPLSFNTCIIEVKQSVHILYSIFPMLQPFHVEFHNAG